MRVEIPMLAPLKATIEAGPTAGSSGRLHKCRAQRALIDRRAASGHNKGVRGKSAHGLHKEAATRAAENGATERELAAIFGWSEGRDGDALH